MHKIVAAAAGGRAWCAASMRLFALLLLVLSTALAGCAGQCRRLSDKLCECEPNSLAREECKRRAAQDDSSYPSSPEQEQVCAALIDGCDCNALATPEGKVACGLARDGGS